MTSLTRDQADPRLPWMKAKVTASTRPEERTVSDDATSDPEEYFARDPKDDLSIPERPDLSGVAALKAARLGSNSYLIERAAEGQERLTIPGVIVRTTILFGVLVVCASIPWSMALVGKEVGVFFWGGLIGGLVLALLISAQPSWAAVLGPLYAACEGLTLGALSGILETAYRGIVAQAFLLTFCVFAAMLAIHLFFHPAKNKAFRTAVFGATLAILIIYAVDLLSIALGLAGFAFLHESSPLAILIAAVFLVIAGLSLTFDFQFVEDNAAAGVPRELEWYAAFSLMVSIVWIYVQALRLLSLLRDR